MHGCERERERDKEREEFSCHPQTFMPAMGMFGAARIVFGQAAESFQDLQDVGFLDLLAHPTQGRKERQMSPNGENIIERIVLA